MCSLMCKQNRIRDGVAACSAEGKVIDRRDRRGAYVCVSGGRRGGKDCRRGEGGCDTQLVK